MCTRFPFRVIHSTKCPHCGSAAFTANVDDVDTVFCINDDCKWKAPVGAGTEFQEQYFR